MKCSEIHIRDPFVLEEDGIYYLYGTRGANFGIQTGGFDVYTSRDLENWVHQGQCFDSESYGMNLASNWAPEVHKYRGGYYLFATFTRPDCGLRGTWVLKADSPLGPFRPHSNGVVTPREWECLDGTLYIDQTGNPWIVFCHEHTQIIDGTMCYARLSEDLTEMMGEPVTLFAASSVPGVGVQEVDQHYITDGPFFYRTETGTLLMIWSSFMENRYAQLLLRFDDGEPSMNFTHLPPLLTSDSGHGMIFRKDGELILTLHSPNIHGQERPVFLKLRDLGDTITLDV